MSRSYRVCPKIDCPELIAPGETQCAAGHGRPKNASWSRDRNITEHNKWAAAAKKAHPYCSVCGETKKLDVHHGPNGEPIVLCNTHHQAVDPHARAR
jgi:hypothetical protein